MADWIKLVLTIIGVMMVFYSTMQTQGYRLDKLERDFDEHLNKHEIQYKEIQQTLTEIKVQLAEIANRK